MTGRHVDWRLQALRFIRRFGLVMVFVLIAGLVTFAWRGEDSAQYVGLTFALMLMIANVAFAHVMVRTMPWRRRKAAYHVDAEDEHLTVADFDRRTASAEPRSLDAGRCRT